MRISTYQKILKSMLMSSNVDLNDPAVIKRINERVGIYGESISYINCCDGDVVDKDKVCNIVSNNYPISIDCDLISEKSLLELGEIKSNIDKEVFKLCIKPDVSLLAEDIKFIVGE